ncbi:MAG: hypothetical protein COU81_04095 [Candidatus Portnoybacteria bacterium CG10_big_fil_rev_8_21_14_0_10_36_7]|uniref:DUF2779 domain-containing protein n=1 Tax=Candidatus Portnoybacteria bacterium CG10_big_fil_rev_8_21_14_0_10_36_7 TaxID=1974812 RepID=A0A2M8KD08_9BACT|nr:MAG: hypothetical protein COU81_04095 [Candidatus Portnoybacteria bacterium CG10_big_fil_rev_8_21_14_0_10_36_7]
MQLSKSDYMLFLRHPAWLWLKKFDKSKLPPIDDDLQAMFDAGHEFESHAEQLFPGAVRLGFNNYDEYLALTGKTLQEISNGTQTILQGRLDIDGLTCIFDVLQKVGDKEFDLIEIKASTKAKPEHEYDLAFQLLVLEKSGYSIRNILVIHANKEYERNGEIDPNLLCAQTDITEKVRALKNTTEQQVALAQAVLNKQDIPDISLRHINSIGVPGVSQWFQEWLTIFKTLKPNSDPYNVYELSYPSSEQIGKLEGTGITRIADVPDYLVLRPKQFAQIKTTREDKPIVDKEKIREFLEDLQYPLYFFDYETMSSVIPFFDGMSPYKDYPFQYSLHVLRTPDAELEHYEYLHAENSNPMPKLLKQLKEDIGNEGTVLTWNMSYEKGCNDRMVALYPKHAEFLAELNERIDDLMSPFSEMWYFHKDFFGSASVKKVMPVLAPELSYKELNVGDGLLARRMWTQTILEGKYQDSRSQIMEDLIKYCTLDTFAMVRILEVLRKIAYE